jgi:excisionase family DNA binding protein
MSNDEKIIDMLTSIDKKLNEQTLLQKDILNLNEACAYLDISASHLYKMTSSKSIPHFCPQGKKLYFKRVELDEWLMRNRQSSSDEIEKAANDYLIRNKRK